MSHINLHGFDRNIQRRAELSLDRLSKLLTEMMLLGREEAVKGRTYELQEFHVVLRRLIHVVPHLVNGVQIELYPDLSIEDVIVGSNQEERVAYARRWQQAADNPHTITLPLPTDEQACEGMHGLLSTFHNFENHDFDPPRPPSLFLWNGGMADGPMQRVWCGIKLSSIKEIRAVKGVPFTPVLNQDGELQYWPDPLDWYLRFRGFKPVTDDPNLAKPSNIDPGQWEQIRSRLLVPDSIRRMGPECKKRPNTLWLVGDYDGDNCRTPPLEYGYFVVNTVLGAVLYKIVDRICWPLLDVSRPDITAITLYQMFELAQSDDQVSVNPFHCFYKHHEIIVELAKIPVS